jgi:predicted dehydrogenase
LPVPDKQPLRLALIGCGEVTREKHAPAINRLARVSVVALCDLDAARCRDVGTQFPGAQLCTDFREALSIPVLDAVGVLTDPASHAELAIATMRAGKHVLIEKPLALVTADAVRLIREARSANVIAMTGFHMRFHRLIEQARERIARGDLGEIETIRVIWHSPRGDKGIAAWKTTRATGGGALVEIAVHHLDMVRFLLGTEFDWIHAASRNGTREDEAAVLAARMLNGVLVTGEFSERSPHEIEVVVSGKAGWLRVDCLKFDGLESRGYYDVPGQPSVRIRSLATFVRNLPEGMRTMQRGGDYRISYEESWRHFVGCVRQGIPTAVRLEDGLRAVEAVNAAVESVRTGQPQRVGLEAGL